MAWGSHDPDREHAQCDAIAVPQSTPNAVLAAIRSCLCRRRDAVNRDAAQLGNERPPILGPESCTGEQGRFEAADGMESRKEVVADLAFVDDDAAGIGQSRSDGCTSLASGRQEGLCKKCATGGTSFWRECAAVAIQSRASERE